MHVSLIMPVTFKNRESNEVHKAYVLVFSRIRMQYIILRAVFAFAHSSIC